MSSPIDAYLVCATPRTGSSLLSGLLSSTGVAGRPLAYFREPDMPLWAGEWALPLTGTGHFHHPAYVTAAIAAGRTGNGVFGAKVMWGSFRALLDALAAAPGGHGDDRELIANAFGRVRFVHLYRRDPVAQAVSWSRAEQTGAWRVGGSGEIGADTPTGVSPRYDAARLDELVAEIAADERSWREWFARFAVDPIDVAYEDLDDDALGTVRRVLDGLGLDASTADDARPAHRRQADALNREWTERYRAERTFRSSDEL